MEEEEAMGRVVESYFQDMFTTSDLSHFDEILMGLQPTITEDMSAALSHEY